MNSPVPAPTKRHELHSDTDFNELKNQTMTEVKQLSERLN